jgi:hypothetical protein
LFVLPLKNGRAEKIPDQCPRMAVALPVLVERKIELTDQMLARDHADISKHQRDRDKGVDIAAATVSGISDGSNGKKVTAVAVYLAPSVESAEISIRM